MSGYLVNVIYIVFRLVPLIIIAPIDSFRRVPFLVRLILAISLAVIFAGFTSAHEIASVEGIKSLDPAILASEFMIGAVLCFSFHAASATMHFFGQLIDMQIGFVAATVFDPSSERMAGPTSTLFGLLFAVSFFSTGFHYTFLEALKNLYDYVPTGAVIELSASWYSVFGRIFAFGFVLASPVIIVLLLADISLALISRSMPQVQIYFVGLPLKIGLGLLVLTWVVEGMAEPLLKLLLGSLHSWDHLMTI